MTRAAILALALMTPQPAQRPVVNAEDVLRQVCVMKLADPASLTPEWRKFCAKLGVRTA